MKVIEKNVVKVIDVCYSNDYKSDSQLFKIKVRFIDRLIFLFKGDNLCFKISNHKLNAKR